MDLVYKASSSLSCALALVSRLHIALTRRPFAYNPGVSRTFLLRCLSRRVSLPFDQVRNCSLEELASALEAFGTLSVRDVKFLRRCSTALAKVCEDQQLHWQSQFLKAGLE